MIAPATGSPASPLTLPVTEHGSPGVLMIYAYVLRALEAGKRRLDFLRGNEPYKYEWGAVDEPIQRLLVRRRNG